MPAILPGWYSFTPPLWPTISPPLTGPLFEKSRGIEDVQELRLLVLLEELVRDKGIMQAAQDLNVDHRTLAVSLETGRLSRRMRGALEKALLEGGGSPAREQRERNDRLEGRVERMEEVGREMNEGLAAVQGEVRELREAQERGMQRLARLEGGEGVEHGRGSPTAAQRSRRRLATPASLHRPGCGGSFPNW